VVTLRFFGGFAVGEVAELLGVSVSTVESDFRTARAWLHSRLG
jgi:DNA-directed RNA polymerase specialized sigma24 family protein